jgi:hypothetical protein
MTLGVSAHGTLVAVQLTPGAVFTTVAELGDITPPGLTRNEFDATTQEKDIDAYVLGVLRRGAFTVPVNWLPQDSTHSHSTGVLKLLKDNTVTGWRIRFPAAAGGAAVDWIMSGQVQGMVPKAPVDGKLSADITLRFSGLMTIGGVQFG